MNRALEARLRKLEQDRGPARQIVVFVKDGEDAEPKIAAHNPLPQDMIVVIRTFYEDGPDKGVRIWPMRHSGRPVHH